MIAEVIVDVANSEVDKIFDYIAIPDVSIGDRVLVPFGRRTIEGYVINLKDKSDLPKDKLKSLISIIDDYPILLPELLDLSYDMITRNHLRFIDCLRLMVPTQLRTKHMSPIYIAYLKIDDNYNPDEHIVNIRANAKLRRDMLLYIEAGKEYLRSELNKHFGRNNVEKLLSIGIATMITKHKIRKPNSIVLENKFIQLNDEQRQIVESVLCNPDKPHLVFGVTGSGKTEVYMNIIDNVIKQGKSAIMLVPEISLTPQMMGVFVARFGDNVAMLHSGLSDGERFDEWQRIRSGDAKIVIGARSAIFAPLTNIGAIILDEEHDSSYKSESNPRFLTHDVAKFRGQYNKCPLVLGSATPSLDSFQCAMKGEYILHELTTRANKKAMPNISVVDMCKELHNGNTNMFSRQLLEELHKCIEENNQAMLFLNRRGFSSYVICKECGYVAKCSDCDVSLVYHKEDNQLKCHYCNKRYKALDACPQCHSTYIRMGAIGTQRVVEELQSIFPKVKILRMDNDTTQTKDSLVNILDEFSRTKPCILVGTQMIAKGHDFPDVTVVGIVDADMSLHFSDYRAVERTFQLITQVAGRAGRSSKAGKVILQTYTPKHYVYRYIKDYDYKGFFDKEINLREVTQFPPFAKIIRILISGESDELTYSVAIKIFDDLKNIRMRLDKDFIYFALMRSPVSRIQNKYRYQVLMRIKIDNSSSILDEIYHVVNRHQNAKTQIFVEQNPANMS